MGAVVFDGQGGIAPRDGEWIDPGQVRVMLDQAGLSGWEIMEGDIDEHETRGWLFGVQDELSKTAPDASSSSLILPVDQHFNVKGVGLVAIGYVHQEACPSMTRSRCCPPRLWAWLGLCR